MGWETRGAHRYYYAKRREKGRVVSMYLGKEEPPEAPPAHARGRRDDPFDVLDELREAGRLVEGVTDDLVRLALGTSGFYQHRGQWRPHRRAAVAAFATGHPAWSIPGQPPTTNPTTEPMSKKSKSTKTEDTFAELRAVREEARRLRHAFESRPGTGERRGGGGPPQGGPPQGGSPRGESLRRASAEAARRPSPPPDDYEALVEASLEGYPKPWADLVRRLRREEELWEGAKRAVRDAAHAMANQAYGGNKAELLRRMEALREALGYEGSPALDRVAIDRVVFVWAEVEMTQFLYGALAYRGDAHALPNLDRLGKHVERLERRLQRAQLCLARLRKLAAQTPVIQVNLGHQQVIQSVVSTPAPGD